MNDINQEHVDRMVREAEKRGQARGEEIGEKRGRADMKRKIQEQAECTICYQIHAQLQQCPNGHLTCQRCIEKCDNTCATCRCSMDYVRYGTKIRALAMEKLIDAADLERKCRHSKCDFSAPKEAMARHEQRCLLRLVPCPVLYCHEKVELLGLQDHMNQCKVVTGGITEEVEITKNARYSLTTTISAKDFESSNSLEQSHFKIIVLGKKKFIPRFTRNDDCTYYAWVQLIGGQVKASKYKVTISIGRGTDTNIIHRGKVFPIDIKQNEIIREFSGVASFAQNGMGRIMFCDAPEDEREITIHYAITESSAPRSFNELQSRWQSTRAFTGFIILRVIDSDSHSDLERSRSRSRSRSIEFGRASSDNEIDGGWGSF